jgi:hypothetical protein
VPHGIPTQKIHLQVLKKQSLLKSLFYLKKYQRKCLTNSHLAAAGLSNAKFAIFTSPATHCVDCCLPNSKDFGDNDQPAGNKLLHGVQKLTGDNLKVVWAYFSTLS